MNYEYDNKGKGLFFGVITVLTLVVAIIGATFAYFTATAGSANNAVNVASAKILISYTEGEILQAQDLIPATETVAVNGYNDVSANGQCLDDNLNKVCYVYRFEVTNGGATSQNITGTILSVLNDFTNLSYIVYSIDDLGVATAVKTMATLPVTGVSASLYSTGTDTVAAGETNNYEVLIFLNETGSAQDDEQDNHYSATITIGIAGITGGQITGTIQ